MVEIETKQTHVLNCAKALKQSDPINWIQRFRKFVAETDPPRISDQERDQIITKLTVRWSEYR